MGQLPGASVSSACVSVRALALFVFRQVKQSAKSHVTCRQQVCTGGLSSGERRFLELGSGRKESLLPALLKSIIC